MRTSLPLLVLAAVLAAAPAFGQAGSETQPAGYPDGEKLLGEVIASLPGAPIRVFAQLLSRDKRGTVERSFNAEMRLDWHGITPSARYTIRDSFGENLEGLNVTWQDGTPAYRYYKGQTLLAAPTPDLFSSIQGTDLSWVDLSLSFLWWPGGKTVGSEKVKGRACYIVDVPAPAAGAAPGYLGVRLWIDPEIHILLQARAFGPGNEPVKLLEVKSFRKVRDVWVIQDVDVSSLPSRHRTSLKVRQVEALGPDGKPLPEEKK